MIKRFFLSCTAIATALGSASALAETVGGTFYYRDIRIEVVQDAEYKTNGTILIVGEYGSKSTAIAAACGSPAGEKWHHVYYGSQSINDDVTAWAERYLERICS